MSHDGIMCQGHPRSNEVSSLAYVNPKWLFVFYLKSSLGKLGYVNPFSLILVNLTAFTTCSSTKAITRLREFGVILETVDNDFTR